MAAPEHTSEAAAVKGCDFAFRDGHLVPIAAPLQVEEGQSYEPVWKELGFDHADDGFGWEYTSPAMKIRGPGARTFPYEWLCDYDINGYCYSVWLRDFAELHAYLIYAQPLLALVQGQKIVPLIADAYKWTFDRTDGLYADHVRKQEDRAQRQIDYYRSRAKQKETAKAGT